MDINLTLSSDQLAALEDLVDGAIETMFDHFGCSDNDDNSLTETVCFYIGLFERLGGDEERVEYWKTALDHVTQDYMTERYYG